jgi:hypothetical protein
MQDHLQKHLQPAQVNESYIQASKLDALPICLIQQQIGILAMGNWLQRRFSGPNHPAPHDGCLLGELACYCE